MKSIFELFQSLITINFLILIFIIALLGWIVIAWQDYREQKDIAKRFDRENKRFAEKYGRPEKR